MNTVEDYHLLALTDLRSGTTVHLTRAAIYAELAKTAPVLADHIGAQVADQARLTVRAIPRLDEVLEEGAPEGWRWAKYDEVSEYLTDKEVDELSNAGVQIVVQVDR